MSLLSALDHHYATESAESVEVEYRLLSWGEIYPPFQGNREHSTAARHILGQYPFKLFSTSTPHSRPPQKLSLAFRSHPGFNADETAKEFAAFLSLVTRRRLFAVGLSRYDGLPIEEPTYLYQSSHFQAPQQDRTIQPKDIYLLLAKLQQVDSRLAESYVLATRLYHSAIEMMYSEPEFAYLFLIMSLEAVSSVAYEDLKPSNEGGARTELDQFLDSSYPGWRSLCDISTEETRSQVVEMLLTRAYFTRRKFRQFVLDNLPEAFWSETVDDAKPDYIQTVIVPGPSGFGQEQFSRSDKTMQPWERVDRDNLKKILDQVYDARSRFIHQGTRLPASIVTGHFVHMPGEAAIEVLASAGALGSGETPVLPLPCLLTVERMVSYAMAEFLRKQSCPN